MLATGVIITSEPMKGFSSTAAVLLHKKSSQQPNVSVFWCRQVCNFSSVLVLQCAAAAAAAACPHPRFIASFGEERFAAMDAQRSGIVGVVLVRGFVKAMSPTANDAQVRTMASGSGPAAKEVILLTSICVIACKLKVLRLCPAQCCWHTLLCT
jgi:hypothetical protein